MTVKTDDVSLGFRRFNNRFTTPIEIALTRVPGDEDANVGALAKAISTVKNSNRGKYPPGVNLVLYTSGELNEESISSLRSSLSQVNGVEVNAAGRLGGSIQDGGCWVRLGNAAGAMLLEIEKKANTSGLTYRREESIR